MNNANPNDVEEEHVDPQVDEKPLGEDNPDQDPFQETYINMLWDIEDTKEQHEEIHTYHTWRKGPLITNPSIPAISASNI